MKKTILVILALTNSSHAAEKTAIGYGGNSCGDFIVAAQGSEIGKVETFVSGRGKSYPSDINGYLEWGLGYITALIKRDTQLRMFSMSAYDLTLRQYCTQYPTSSFLFAVQEYIKNSGMMVGN